MARDDEARAYFRAEPAWDSLLKALRHRYETLSRVTGTIPIASRQHERLLQNLGAKVIGGRLALLRFEQALGATRFACDLPQLLEWYFEQPIISRAARQESHNTQWRALRRQLELRARLAATAPKQAEGVLEQAGALFTNEAGALRDASAPVQHEEEATGKWEQALPVLNWLTADERYLMHEWIRQPATFGGTCALAIRAVVLLDRITEPTPLPVFASRVTGDPHAFDAGTPAGRYLERALAYLYPEAAEVALQAAELRDSLLAAAGLMVDDISSAVVVAGLDGSDQIVIAARAAGLIWSVPLYTVNRLRAIVGWRSRAFVVENPSVFRCLVVACESLPNDQRPTLVCTSGELSLAGRRLLDMLVASGTELYYSGDFDPRGLSIARGLQRRCPTLVRLWRMDVPNYQEALRQSPSRDGSAGTDRLALLEPDFPALTAAIRESGPAYQEALISQLVADVLAFSKSSKLHWRKNQVP